MHDSNPLIDHDDCNTFQGHVIFCVAAQFMSESDEDEDDTGGAELRALTSPRATQVFSPSQVAIDIAA